jgi:hypothetical protein
MAFNPDEKTRAMGAHTYRVDELDLTAHGFPGLTFSGWLAIEIDMSCGADCADWYIEHAQGGDGDATRYYLPGKDKDPIGAAIADAVTNDPVLCQDITSDCYLHGED